MTRGNTARKLTRQAWEWEVTENLAVMGMTIAEAEFTEACANGSDSVSELYFNFPDPEGAAHAWRRKLICEGVIEVKTDSATPPLYRFAFLRKRDGWSGEVNIEVVASTEEEALTKAVALSRKLPSANWKFHLLSAEEIYSGPDLVTITH